LGWEHSIFVAKPADVSARMPEIAAELIGKIKAAAQSNSFRPQLMPEGTRAIKGRAPIKPIRPG